jgi:hypothetical protein
MQATTPAYLTEEGFTSCRKIEVENDPVLFSILTGMLEQTIRCRHLDVARAFRDAFIAKVDAVEPSCGASDKGIADLFCRALEGKLQLKKAEEALNPFNSCDLMQRLFIQGNPNKTWLIERLNNGISVSRDDEVIIPWFSKTFSIEVCIYWLEGDSEYERIEFLSPRHGMKVNIYQRTELDTETGLLYFPDYDEEALEPRYPNCCLPAKLTKEEILCSKENYPRRRSDKAFSSAIRKEQVISSAEDVPEERISATESVRPSVPQTSSLHGPPATGVRSNLDPEPIRSLTEMHIPAAKGREPPELEGFVKFRRIECVEGDPVLFAILNGMLEQTIRCRRLDVANTFREAFLAKVNKSKVEVMKGDQNEYNRVINLFNQALEGRLTLEQARETISEGQLTDVMQALFIKNNPTKIWLIEGLNDGIPVGRDDDVVIPWFCKTFGIEICIYWLEGHSEYDRIEFLSPRHGMIVNIYQRQNEFETETGLLYFPDYNEEALEPRYPNCCQAFQVPRWETKCSSNKSLIPRRSSLSNPHSSSSQPNSFKTSYSREPSTLWYKGEKETIEGILVVEVKLPPQAIARLKRNLQEQGCSPDEATRLINSGPSSSKQLMLQPQLIRTEGGGVVPETGISIAANEEQSENPEAPTPILAGLQEFTSDDRPVERESLGIISVAMGTNPSLSQGVSTISSQPSKPRTIKPQPRLKQVKVEETKTSDPLTRSLPPTRVKIVPKTFCSVCKTGIIGFSYVCSTARCKVCVQCLVRSALPPKTCPGCRHITLRDEDVDILEKFRPN